MLLILHKIFTQQKRTLIQICLRFQRDFYPIVEPGPQNQGYTTGASIFQEFYDCNSNSQWPVEQGSKKNILKTKRVLRPLLAQAQARRKPMGIVEFFSYLLLEDTVKSEALMCVTNQEINFPQKGHHNQTSNFPFMRSM